MKTKMKLKIQQKDTFNRFELNNSGRKKYVLSRNSKDWNRFSPLSSISAMRFTCLKFYRLKELSWRMTDGEGLDEENTNNQCPSIRPSLSEGYLPEFTVRLGMTPEC